MRKIFKVAAVGVALLLSVVAVLSLQAETVQPKNPLLRMATTTSTDNSGLLNVILPAFQQATGYEVQVIAVGTGKALRMGEAGDVDVILVHARGAEEKFVADGHGPKRHDVMYNDFVFVGPASDPAGVNGIKEAALALKKISQSKICVCLTW